MSLAVGASLALEVWLPGKALRAEAEVIYANPPSEARRHAWPLGMAVVFRGLDAAEEDRVRRCVLERSEATRV